MTIENRQSQPPQESTEQLQELSATHREESLELEIDTLAESHFERFLGAFRIHEEITFARIGLGPKTWVMYTVLYNEQDGKRERIGRSLQLNSGIEDALIVQKEEDPQATRIEWANHNASGKHGAPESTSGREAHKRIEAMINSLYPEEAEAPNTY